MTDAYESTDHYLHRAAKDQRAEDRRKRAKAAVTAVPETAARLGDHGRRAAVVGGTTFAVAVSPAAPALAQDSPAPVAETIIDVVPVEALAPVPEPVEPTSSPLPAAPSPDSSDSAPPAVADDDPAAPPPISGPPSTDATDEGDTVDEPGGDQSGDDNDASGPPTNSDASDGDASADDGPSTEPDTVDSEAPAPDTADDVDPPTGPDTPDNEAADHGEEPADGDPAPELATDGDMSEPGDPVDGEPHGQSPTPDSDDGSSSSGGEEALGETLDIVEDVVDAADDLVGRITDEVPPAAEDPWDDEAAAPAPAEPAPAPAATPAPPVSAPAPPPPTRPDPSPTTAPPTHDDTAAPPVPVVAPPTIVVLDTTPPASSAPPPLDGVSGTRGHGVAVTPTIAAAPPLVQQAAGRVVHPDTLDDGDLHLPAGAAVSAPLAPSPITWTGRTWMTAMSLARDTGSQLIVYSDTVTDEPQVGHFYMIRPGDSLSGIVQRLWGDDADLTGEDITELVVALWEVNQGRVTDANYLLPGVIIAIPAPAA